MASARERLLKEIKFYENELEILNDQLIDLENKKRDEENIKRVKLMIDENISVIKNLRNKIDLLYLLN